MKRSLRPLAVFVGVFMTVLALCAYGNSRSCRIRESGRIDSALLETREVRIIPSERVTLTMDSSVAAVVLLRQGSAAGHVKADGQTLSFRDVVPIMRAFASCTLECPDAGGDWSVELECSEGYLNGQNRLFVCAPIFLVRIEAVLSICLPLICGVLLAASFYGFSMYAFKRMKVLQLFALYTLCVFLWSFLSCFSSMLPLSSPLVNSVINHSFDTAVVLGMLTCISFCFPQQKRSRRWFEDWRCILGLCVLNMLLSTVLPGRVNSIWLFFLYMIGVMTMIYFCSQNDNKPWVVLVGLSITQALRLTSLMKPDTTSTLYLGLLRSMKMFTMPYVLSCMVYINSIYGSKFKESEQLRETLEETNRQLDRKVAERTAELEKQQQIRNNLLTNIFHDLRSPLMVMRGCINKMQQGDCTAQDISVMDERLTFITNLTEDLFSVVKLEDPSIIMDTDQLEMDTLLQETVDGLRIEAQQKGFDIDLQLEPGVIAWGDEQWIRRAFQNLIENAIHYSKPNGRNVQVRMLTEEDKIKTYVSDDGVGVSAEDQQLIFERYYRVSGTRKHDSSGLGLSIAMNVARHHQGTLEVSSQVGCGTTFCLTLPLWGIRE